MLCMRIFCCLRTHHKLGNIKGHAQSGTRGAVASLHMAAHGLAGKGYYLNCCFGGVWRLAEQWEGVRMWDQRSSGLIAHGGGGGVATSNLWGGRGRGGGGRQ